MRAPVPTLLLAALAVLPRPAAAQDAGIGASPDAGVSGLEPTLTSTTPPPVPTEAEVEQVEAENSALQQLMAGELPAAFEIRSLFEVDVTREGAIQARLETLGREITREQRLVETLRLATRTATSAAQPDPDQVVALAVRLRFAQARLQRSQARRAFLSQPATTRAALLHNEERQRAIQEQRRGAAEARAAAEREALEAEQARQEALEAARQAVTEAERALASERARVESYRATLASLRADHADARQGWATTQSSLLERHQALTKSALSPELAPAAADKTFREVLGYIEESREKLARAIGTLQDSLQVPELGMADDQAADHEALAEQRAALNASIAGAKREAEELRRDVATLLRGRAEAYASDLTFLNDLRLALLPRLTPAYHREVLGFTGAGFEQVVLEVNHLSVMARWYAVRVRTMDDTQRSLRDLVTLGLAGLEVLKLIGLVILALYLRRHHKAWLTRLHAGVLAYLSNRPMRALADRWLRFLEAHVFETGFLVFAYLFFDLGGWDVPEVRLLRAVVLTYAWYRLILSLLHHAITEAAHAGAVQLSEARNQKILQSVRLVGRYGLVVVVFLIASRTVLGRGYLYQLVVEFFWIGTLPIALVLVNRWREDIADAYLAMYPKGRFAIRVRNTRTRAVGFFVVLVAFTSVAARGISIYIREQLLSFEQTRKALAYVFRRRLERQSSVLGAEELPVELPADLVAALSEQPVQEDLRIDRWPGLPQLLAEARRLVEGGDGTTVALVAERGGGKTSWLDEAERKLDFVHVDRAAVEERPDPEALVPWLARTLGIDEARSADALVERLLAGPPRVVLLDGGQNLMKRSVGGTATYERFMQIASQSTARVVWVVTFSRYAWRHLECRFKSRTLFNRSLAIGTWSEAEIGQLIERRMSASGYVADYRDLIMDPVEGTALELETTRTAERFRRLLWDYADGNPRVALHFWQLALIPEGERRVRVRLFARPDEARLVRLGEEARFALAAVAIHENMSIEELAETLAYPLEFCKSVVTYLENDELLQRRARRYVLGTGTYRAVIRYLRRNNLLHA
jgi:hypothetical protein